MQDTRAHIIAILVITIICGYVIIPPGPSKPKIPWIGEAKLELGIDLAGGAELHYRVLYEPGQEKVKIQSVVDVLINRIKQRKALHEPRVSSSGEDMIVIQIPGVDARSLIDMRKLIESVGKLELKEVAPADVMLAYNQSKNVPDGYEVKANTQRESDAAENIGDTVLVLKKAVIEGKDIATASSEQDIKGGSNYVVAFSLHDNGSKLFDESAARLHARTPKGRIAIILDGTIVSMPRVIAEKFNGHGTITGGFNANSAKDLAIILRSGSLPVAIGRLAVDAQGNTTQVPKEPEAEKFVGPSLGQDSILRGMAASILGIILVAAFMIIYYRGGGVIAVVGLVLNLIWLMAIMVFFGATMTLPGIAGIVLTIGMAVDANILIYERVREEMAKGKTAAQAFDAGYDRAFSAIADSNVTSLLAGLVLYYFGSGPVQGFAVTLVIGIITTLLSVLWACKVMERHLVTRGVITKWSMMQLFKTPNVNWVKTAKPSLVISSIMIIAGLSVFWMRRHEEFGIEFTGGTALSYTFHDAVDINQVRDRIGAIKGTDGIPKYADAEIMTMASTTSMTKMALISGAKSREFQMRTRSSDPNAVRKDVQEAFAPPGWTGAAFARDPFEPISRPGRPDEIPKSERWAAPDGAKDGTAGGGFYVYMVDDGKLDFAKAAAAISEKFKATGDLVLTRDTDGNPIFGGDRVGVLAKEQGAGGRFAKVKILFLKLDIEASSGLVLDKARDAIIALASTDKSPFQLATDPFTSVQSIGPAVASQLLNTTIIALIISAALMIIYIAIRFHYFIFGVAAVIALTHDTLLSLGLMAVAGWVIPKSWGLSFELNMSTFAALLTIVGYSVNDKIVTFDRIRENLSLGKKEETLAELINRSISETLARSVLTSVTVWIVCMILYVFTMTSAGGIASFSFPMLMGVIISMYSSITIAAPLLVWLFGGKKPAAA